jgi:EmrB/QacA subfamily drug resistance transporter
MGRMMSLVGVPMLLAPVFGPVLGGAIVDQASWRWLFYLNLPIGVAALVSAQRFLPHATPQPARRLDLRGLALLSPGLALFLYGLTEAGNQGSIGAPRTVAAAAVGLVLIALFVWHALRRGNDALIDPSLFARRGFASAAALNFLLIGALFGSLILLPLYYQLVRDESPLDVGLLLVPQGVGAALAMPLAGWLTDRIGARLVVTTGIAVAVAGILAYTQIGARTSYAYLAAALLVLGLGIGSTVAPSMAALYQTLSRQETPRATSALNVIQRTGGALGTAAFAIVLQRTIAGNLAGLHGGIEQLADLPPARRADVAPSLAKAFGTTFWIAAGLIAATLLPALLLPHRRGSGELPHATSISEAEAAR